MVNLSYRDTEKKSPIYYVCSLCWIAIYSGPGCHLSFLLIKCNKLEISPNKVTILNPSEYSQSGCDQESWLCLTLQDG